MTEKHGNLSINSENIFPIIKKWLYSDHDIFYRELVSNGCDAITKLKKLDVMGEYTLPDDYKPKIDILVNPEKKTIKVIDNGLGMTAEEVDEYINQIAFSGATDFLEKYKDKSSEEQIIGHFGLGFYSAFMVADEVSIDTLSWQEGAEAVHWSCDGGTEFEMTKGSRTTVGTEITLFLNEDCLEFANEYRAREVLNKYCSFMPTEIYLSNENAETQYETIDAEDRRDTDTVIETIIEEPKTEERENENGEKETVEISPRKEKLKIVKRPVPLNETHPLWTKHPNECTEEEYKTFYRDVFQDYKEPLFWIHLNMDYPFNLKGILYFPKINTEYDSIEGTIKLYNNQVFIADNIKEVIPEFLMLLKGVIDCPDLPLNVSRSALQNDGFVNKISEYITKKVADKLSGMCKTDKENYEKYWDDISPFIKFGCLKDEKFCDRMNDYILFKDIYDKYMTLPELLKAEEEKEEEKAGGSSEESAAAEETEEDSEKSAAAEAAEGGYEKDDAGEPAEAGPDESEEAATGESGEAAEGEPAEAAAGESAEAVAGESAETGTDESEKAAEGESAEAAAGESAEAVAGESEEAAADTAKTAEESGNADSVIEEDLDEEEEEEEKDTRKTVYYVTDVSQQGQYIRLFKEQNMNAVILDHNIDASFITQLERRNEHYKFMRIDADVTEALKEEGSEEELKSAQDTLTEIFRKALGKENLDVKVEKLKDASIASVITLPEESRRMQDMMKMYNMYGMDPSMFGASETLILNTNNRLVQYILDSKDGEHVPMFCKQLYDLAMLSNQPLAPEAMTAFVARSNEIMMILAGKDQ